MINANDNQTINAYAIDTRPLTGQDMTSTVRNGGGSGCGCGGRNGRGRVTGSAAPPPTATHICIMQCPCSLLPASFGLWLRLLRLPNTKLVYA